MKKKLLKVVYREGFLRVLLPSGELLPHEVDIKIEQDVDEKHNCMVTVTFLAELDLIPERPDKVVITGSPYRDTNTYIERGKKRNK